MVGAESNRCRCTQGLARQRSAKRNTDTQRGGMDSARTRQRYQETSYAEHRNNQKRGSHKDSFWEEGLFPETHECGIAKSRHGRCACGYVRGLDRKSTRLNS